MKILLLGLGKTNKAIKKYLKYKKINYVQAVFENEYKNKYLLADDNLLLLNDIDYAIKSPGILETNKTYLKLASKFNFISELDLLYLLNEKVKTIVITGSNGKTTFVSMLTYLLKKAHKKALSCGNSFKPLSNYYKKFNKIDYLVIEQSSFQLHDLKYYNPFISIILNLQENHIDSSYSLRSYFENKKNIYKYQNKNNYFIYDHNNKNLTNLSTNANIIDLLNYPNMELIKNNLTKYQLNINYLYTILTILHIDSKIILKLNDFKTLKYREETYKFKDITFINDSKSTSVDATLFALSHLASLNETILIIGGKDKNASLSRLNEYKVKYIICYGNILKRAQKELKNIIPCLNLKEAFNIATNIYLPNKTILFSPGTSSFDQYQNYQKRGQHFNNLVHEYEKKYKNK